VNNAGVYQFGPIEEVNPAEFHRHYDLNVLGLLLSIKESLPLFPESGGSIINIGSTAGKMAVPKMSVYSGTKGAVDSITISLSKELGHRKIRVNSLNPGVTETEGTVSQGIVGGEFAAGVVATTPLGRVGQPDDIGGLAALIASDDAYWLTGQLVYAAGGLTM
jgi:3-oxoacyl-[acyl-carrier protein] reductase